MKKENIDKEIEIKKLELEILKLQIELEKLKYNGGYFSCAATPINGIPTNDNIDF